MIQIILAFIAIIPSVATLIVNCYQNKKIDKIDKVRLESDKTYLTDFLSEVEGGQLKTEIQKKINTIRFERPVYKPVIR